jgi:hypothetical protein
MHSTDGPTFITIHHHHHHHHHLGYYNRPFSGLSKSGPRSNPTQEIKQIMLRYSELALPLQGSNTTWGVLRPLRFSHSRQAFCTFRLIKADLAMTQETYENRYRVRLEAYVVTRDLRVGSNGYCMKPLLPASPALRLPQTAEDDARARIVIFVQLPSKGTNNISLMSQFFKSPLSLSCNYYSFFNFLVSVGLK